MNEKIKLHMSLEGVLVYKVKQVLEKWLKEHDQRILREFVEWNVKDVVGNDPKAIKDSLKRVE